MQAFCGPPEGDNLVCSISLVLYSKGEGVV